MSNQFMEDLGFKHARDLQGEATESGQPVESLQLYRDPMDIVEFLEKFDETLPPEVEDYWHGYLKAWD